jgi:hypothetical protein
LRILENFLFRANARTALRAKERDRVEIDAMC